MIISGKRVPAWILLFVILAYIGFGAFVFATYQGWNFVDGLFFSFAVLGTIGLIDINPSSSPVSSTTNRDLTSEQAEFAPSGGRYISSDDSESDNASKGEEYEIGARGASAIISARRDVKVTAPPAKRFEQEDDY